MYAAALLLCGQVGCNGGNGGSVPANYEYSRPIIFEIRFAESLPFGYPQTRSAPTWSQPYSNGPTWSQPYSNGPTWSQPYSNGPTWSQRRQVNFSAGFQFNGGRRFFCPTCP